MQLVRLECWKKRRCCLVVNRVMLVMLFFQMWGRRQLLLVVRVVQGCHWVMTHHGCLLLLLMLLLHLVCRRVVRHRCVWWRRWLGIRVVGRRGPAVLQGRLRLWLLVLLVLRLRDHACRIVIHRRRAQVAGWAAVGKVGCAEIIVVGLLLTDHAVWTNKVLFQASPLSMVAQAVLLHVLLMLYHLLRLLTNGVLLIVKLLQQMLLPSSQLVFDGTCRQVPLVEA